MIEKLGFCELGVHERGLECETDRPDYDDDNAGGEGPVTAAMSILMLPS